MSTPEKKENFSKLSLEALEELYHRQNNILKNKKVIEKLPDKGKQLTEKLERVGKEIQLRNDTKSLESTLNTLAITNEDVDALKEKHVQHICQIEKSPNKERYKPFSTLVKSKDLTGKPTQLIPLTESITLQVEQATKSPLSDLKSKIEGDQLEDEDNKAEPVLEDE